MNERGPFDQSGAPEIDQHLPDELPREPFALFEAWYARAHAERVQPNPNVMALATVDADGRPSARMVLCKRIDAVRGYLVFYTNGLGRKGRALEADPRAAACFHWDDLDLQVRMEGVCVHAPESESDAYFASRPLASRIGAWASRQSEPIASREALLERVKEVMRRFGVDEQTFTAPGVVVPRPPHWGGWRLWADRVELWMGSKGRLHDRAVWSRGLTPRPGGDPDAAFSVTAWSATRLQP